MTKVKNCLSIRQVYYDFIRYTHRKHITLHLRKLKFYMYVSNVVSRIMQYEF